MLHDGNQSKWTARENLRRWLAREWWKAALEYESAGAPFGPSSEALAVWVEYGRMTTAN